MEPLWNGVGMPQRTAVSLSVLHTWQAQGAGALRSPRGHPSPPHYQHLWKAGAHVFSRRAAWGILTSHFHLFNIEFVEIIYQPSLPSEPGEAGQSSAAGS